MPATPRQLMHEAMSMGQPSRVPSMCQLAIGHVMLNTDIHPIDYFLSSEAYAEGHTPSEAPEGTFGRYRARGFYFLLNATFVALTITLIPQRKDQTRQSLD